MSNLNGKEVVVARLHAATHMLGYGAIKTVITKAETRGLNMYKSEGGLQLTGKDAKTGKSWEGFIPDGNIISLEFVADKA